MLSEKSLTERVTFEQQPGGDEEANDIDTQEKDSRCRVQQVHRSEIRRCLGFARSSKGKSESSER